MNSFALEIWNDECKRVTFYTIRKEDAMLSETDRFFEKALSSDVYREAANDLLALLLRQMGDRLGAIDEFFNREEQALHSLPPKGIYGLSTVSIHFDDYPLRLYALRIPSRTDIVVLMCGGSKLDVTTKKLRGAHQTIDDLSLKFSEAQTYARKICDALADGTILINDKARTLESWDGADEIFL